MFQNYFKNALRSLTANKTFSVINLMGLVIGFATGILIFQYIAYEKSFDAFNDNGKNIYRIALRSYQAGALTEQSATSYPAIAPAAKNTIPEINGYTRLFKQPGIIKFGDKKIHEENGYLADASVLTTFDIKMIHGDTNSLKTANSIVISEAVAKKYFGNTNAFQKMIEFENEPYIVKGVFQNYPSNSHLKIDYLLYYPDSELMQQSWRWRNFYTYLVTKAGSNPVTLQQKLDQLLKSNNNNFYRQENRIDEVLLQPLQNIHLHSHLDKEIEANGNITSLNFLLILGIVVIIISWANYINLTIANASYRHKEIGIKKILGASKKQLASQFFTESLLLNCTAVLLATLVSAFANNLFRQFSAVPEYISPWASKGFLLLALPMLLAGLLITGLYPAIVIAHFKPLSLIKGIMSSANQPFSFRKGFIIFQFILATILISGVIVIYNQLNYMTKIYPGFDSEQVVVIKGFGNIDSMHSIQAFRNELSNSAFIKGVSNSAFVPGQEITRIRGIKRKENSISAYHTFANTVIDYDFVTLFGLKFLAGRNFSKDYPSDNKNVLLNEEAVKVLGFRNASEAINKEIINGDRNPDTLTIVGVLKNFHQRSLKFAISPTVFLLGNDNRGFYSLKVQTADWHAVVGFIEKTYRKHFTNSPFDFFFLDDYFSRQYQKDKEFGVIFGIFALIAIGISCLGLFAIVKFLSNQRTKEIGIRKVLGASVSGIIGMLCKDFLKLVVLAVIIASPPAWMIMNKWLQNYPYRINISWWMFCFSAIVVLLIALLTISFQAIKAAVANPVKSLRTE